MSLNLKQLVINPGFKVKYVSDYTGSCCNMTFSSVGCSVCTYLEEN